MNDDPPLEPEPQPPSPEPPPPDLSPLRTEPAGTPFIESAGRGCLGVVSFILAIFIFGTISAAKPIAGLPLSILTIVGMVMLRRRSGPSTILGAVAVGAAVALVLTGACAIVILNF